MRIAKAMVNRIPITKARINLGAVAKRAHLGGEYFILEKDGIPVAGIMGADELEDYLEARDPKMKKQITASRNDYEGGRVRDVGDFVAELRAERAAKKAPRRTRKSA
jgi:antitoxin (DNA-binding transcriptional repressor) of toxin-antitoxin stability system